MPAMSCCGCPSAAQKRCEDCDCHLIDCEESRAEMAFAQDPYMGEI